MQYDSNAYSTGVQVYIAGFGWWGGPLVRDLASALPPSQKGERATLTLRGPRDGPQGCRQGVDQCYFQNCPNPNPEIGNKHWKTNRTYLIWKVKEEGNAYSIGGIGTCNGETEMQTSKVTLSK